MKPGGNARKNPDATREQNGQSPAKSAHSARPDLYQATFGATVSIRKRGFAGGADKSGMSDYWRIPTSVCGKQGATCTTSALRGAPDGG